MHCRNNARPMLSRGLVLYALVFAAGSFAGVPKATANDALKRLQRETQGRLLIQQMRVDEGMEILLKLHRDASNDYLRGKAEVAIGYGYFHLGDYRSALRFYQAARKKLTEEGYRKHELMAANYPFARYRVDQVDQRIAFCLKVLGKTEAAIGVCERINRELKERGKKARTPQQQFQPLWAQMRMHEWLGELYRRAGRPQDAQRTLEEGVKVSEAFLALHKKTMGGGTGGVSTYHSFRQRLFFQLGDYAQALRESDAEIAHNQKYLGKAFQLTIGEVYLYNDRARILRKLKRNEEAVAALRTALTIARDGRSPDERYWPDWGVQKTWMAPPIATRLGKLLAELGRTDEAETLFREAFSKEEQHYAATRSLELRQNLQQRQGFFEKEDPVHRPFARLLASKGQWSEAFSVCESGRMRALVDCLGSAPVRETGAAAVPSDWLQQQRSLQTQIAGLIKQLQMARHIPSLKPQSIARTLKAKRKEYDALRQMLAIKNPGFAVYHTHRLIDVPALERLMAAGGPLADAAVLAFARTDRSLLAFYVDRHGLQGRVITKDLDELQTRLAELRGAIQDRSPDWATVAQACYRELIAPFEKSLADKQRVIVVPDSFLHCLPWAVLTSDGREPWIAERRVVVAPTASVLPVWLNRKPAAAGGRVVAAANPDGSLPHAEREGRALKALYPSAEVLVGGEAREGRLLALTSDARVLHIATHGVINRRRPEFSHLVMAAPADGELIEDGLLNVHEIASNVDVSRTDLVVLSACRTLVSGEAEAETVSIANAFLYAGAGRVVATLWAVDDEASARLMQQFHEQYRQGLPASEALRAAMLKAVRRGEHPYFWGGFELIGLD